MHGIGNLEKREEKGGFDGGDVAAVIPLVEKLALAFKPLRTSAYLWYGNCTVRNVTADLSTTATSHR